MPKEVVPSNDPSDRFLLEVGWHREMDVQVGIRTADDRHLVDEFYGQESVLEKIGEAVEKMISDQYGVNFDYRDSDSQRSHQIKSGRDVLDIVTGSDYGMSSLWWHPSRYQINKLIQLLRKARDQAYGKDE